MATKATGPLGAAYLAIGLSSSELAKRLRAVALKLADLNQVGALMDKHV